LEAENNYYLPMSDILLSFVSFKVEKINATQNIFIVKCILSKCTRRIMSMLSMISVAKATTF
jgi:hypothetical protein